jgi:hypothetical protein
MSFKECHTQHAKICGKCDAILPKMGRINRKAARAVVFRAAQNWGLGIDHLATVQSHGQLQYLIGSLRYNNTTGQLIRMMMDYAELECSCSGNVLEQEYDR